MSGFGLTVERNSPGRERNGQGMERFRPKNELKGKGTEQFEPKTNRMDTKGTVIKWF